MPYQAIVIGGTGAVGSALMQELAASPLCERVTSLVRQSHFRDDSCAVHKQRIHIVDMDQLGMEAIGYARHCDTAFCTMGIGQSRKVSKEQFWKVDVEYTVSFARACKLAGIGHFSLLTSVGADIHSRSRYLHVKGVVEERVSELNFRRVSFFRPSLLITKQIRYGLQDRLTRVLFPLVSGLLPPRFHQITVEDLARAMRLNAERTRDPGVEVLTYPEIRQLLEIKSESAKAADTRR